MIRGLRQERGSMLLIGLQGVGKQSICSLASYFLKYNFQVLVNIKDFTTEKFREFLRKNVLLKCLGSGDVGHITFLLNENQIVKNEILEDINSLLNQGEVYNIFPPEEKEVLVKELKQLAGGEDLQLGEAEIWEYWVNLCKRKVHIVLNMSPVGDALRQRCRMFPSILDCCFIDWYDNWPEGAIYDVSKSSVANYSDCQKISKYLSNCFQIANQ